MPLGTSLGVIRNKKAKISYEYDKLIKKIVYTPANLFFLFDNGKLLGIGCNDTLQLDAQGILEKIDPTLGGFYYLNFTGGDTKAMNNAYGGKAIIVNMLGFTNYPYTDNIDRGFYVAIEDLIDFDSSVTNIYTPFYATCIGIKSDGTLWGWGYNQYNTLGLPFGNHYGISSKSSSKPTPVADVARDITFRNIGKYIINVPTKIGNSNNWKSIVTNPIKTLYRYIDDTQNEYRHILLNTNGEIFKLGGSIGNPEKIGSNNNWKYISYDYAINNNNKLFKLSYVDESEIKKGSVLGSAVIMPITQDDRTTEISTDYPIIEPIYERRASFNAKNMNAFREILTDVKQFQSDSRDFYTSSSIIDLQDETYYFLGNNGILSSYGGKGSYAAPYQRTGNVGSIYGPSMQNVYDGMVNQLSASDSIVRTHKSFYVMDRSGFAITTDNKLTVWGNNTHGRLGINTTDNFIKNMQTLNINVSKVIPNPLNTFIISPDNNLSACGFNSYFGALGDNTTTTSKTFKQILTNVKDVVTGLYGNYAIGTNGKLSAWGMNDMAQLGILEGSHVGGGTFSDASGRDLLDQEYITHAQEYNDMLYYVDYSGFFCSYSYSTKIYKNIAQTTSHVSLPTTRTPCFYITPSNIIYFVHYIDNSCAGLFTTPLSSPNFDINVATKIRTLSGTNNNFMFRSKFIVDETNKKVYLITSSTANANINSDPSLGILKVINLNNINNDKFITSLTVASNTGNPNWVSLDPTNTANYKVNLYLLKAGVEYRNTVTLKKSDDTVVTNSGWQGYTTNAINMKAGTYIKNNGRFEEATTYYMLATNSVNRFIRFSNTGVLTVEREYPAAIFYTLNKVTDVTKKESYIGIFSNILTPKELANVKDVKKVVTSGLAMSNTFAILTTGEVYAWGVNSYNELGINGVTAVTTPTLLPLSGIENIVTTEDYCNIYDRGDMQFFSVSATTTFFIDKNGGLSSCGSNNYGNLGIGVISTRTTNGINHPKDKPISNGIKKINIPPIKSLNAHYFGMLAVGTNHELSAWGFVAWYMDLRFNGTSAIKINLPPVKETKITNPNILENIYADSTASKHGKIKLNDYYYRFTYYAIGMNNHLSGWGDNTIATINNTLTIKVSFRYYGRLGSNYYDINSNTYNAEGLTLPTIPVLVSTDFNTISSIHINGNSFFVLGDIKNKKRIYDPIQIGSDDWKVVDKHGDLAIKMDGTLWCLSAETPYQIGTDSNYTNITYDTPIKSTDKYDTAIVSNYVVSDVDYNRLETSIRPKPSTQVKIYNYNVPILSGGTNVTGVSGNYYMLTQQPGSTTLAKAEHTRLNKLNKIKTIVKY
jgi:alpha-tubulin suppressor-like RCC1 family protein